MYRILMIDESEELAVPGARSTHTFRVPKVGEHVFVKWKEQTKVCEVEDVWTHLNFDAEAAYQGAVQVVVRWAKGIDPSLYVRRFR